jgi:spermidine synthase
MRSDREAAIDGRIASDLQLLRDFVLAMWFDRPAPGPDFRNLYCHDHDFPLALDAPFGIAGPMILDLGTLRVLLSDWSLIQSVMSTEEPARIVLDYTRIMVAGLLLHPAPHQIEMIGLGGGSIAKFCHRYMPECRMTAVESDPEVLALRKRFEIPEDDTRLRVVCADGYDFVDADPSRPDVLIIDGFDHRGRPGRLAWRSFYDRCRARLGESGLLVVNFSGGWFRSLRSAAKLSACFGGQVLVVPDTAHRNRIAIASSMPGFLAYAAAFRTSAESHQYAWLDLPTIAGRIATVAAQPRI